MGPDPMEVRGNKIRYLNLVRVNSDTRAYGFPLPLERSLLCPYARLSGVLYTTVISDSSSMSDRPLVPIRRSCTCKICVSFMWDRGGELGGRAL